METVKSQKLIDVKKRLLESSAPEKLILEIEKVINKKPPS